MARKPVPVTIIDADSTTNDPIVDGGSNSGDGNAVNGFPAIEPGELIDAGTDAGSDAGTGSDGGNSGDGTRRRRGRPPGGGTRTTAKASRNLTGGLDQLLLSIHFFGAGFFEANELMLSTDEAKQYADAINNVAAHYSRNFDPKILAWAQLAFCVGGIYGTRLIAIRGRLKAEAENKSAIGNAPANVREMKRPEPATRTPDPVQPRTPADMFGLAYSAGITE